MTMQLIEHELKRGDIWREQSAGMDEKAQKKWEFAMKKQDQFISSCLQTLLNLAEDLKIEVKMVKRGIIPILLRCLDHNTSAALLKATVNFIWKLSVLENRKVLESGETVEKCIRLLNGVSCTPDLRSSIFTVLFNFSHDLNAKRIMVNAGLVNLVAPSIEGDL